MNRKNKKWIFGIGFATLICLVFVFSLPRFIRNYPRTVSTLSPPSVWLTRWMNNPTCSLPCWENITPGTTTITEAYEILVQLPEITSLSTPRPPSSPTYVYEIFWEMTGGVRCKLVSETGMEVDKVQAISLSVDNIKLELKQVVETFGEPDHILISGCTIISPSPNIYCDSLLVFDSKGVSIHIYSLKVVENDSIKLDPDELIDGITLYPVSEEFLRIHGYKAPLDPDDPDHRYYDWKGYGKYLAPSRLLKKK